MRKSAETNPAGILTGELVRGLGVSRASRLRAVMRQTGLTAETLLDLALDLLEVSSRRLALPPIRRAAVGLGVARWRNVSAEERSRLTRLAVQARWAKHRRRQR